MIRTRFNTIVRKDREEYGTILDGKMFASPVPWCFPQTAGREELMNLLDDSEKETFEEFYLVIPIKVVDLSNEN